MEQRLEQLGWRLVLHGGRHDIWRRGERELALTRHREINEYTVKAILRESGGAEP
jgi:predicted RNA binding protein YcfA (HicA-like mRNA interferase family)